MVKARPKWDRMSGCKKSDEPLELFGPWQTELYIAPVAVDGKVPRNEYGNVALLTYDWLTQIILTSDWLKQRIVTSDWLTQIILTSDWWTGNVELFKPWMLPGGCVHVPINGMQSVIRKSGIDAAPAMVGWDFSGGGQYYDSFNIP